jgi:hypothetical protein
MCATHRAQDALITAMAAKATPGEAHVFSDEPGYERLPDE